jgi:ferrous iron transport protein A
VTHTIPDPTARFLSEGEPGARGVIVRVHPHDDARGALTVEELERRLLELGFVEGAQVEVLHEGLFGRDPMAVRLDDMRVALRRREARAVEVKYDEPPKAGAAA